MTTAVRHIEGIEQAAWADLLRAPSHDDARRLGLFVDQRDGTLTFGAGGVDSILFNRSLGLDSASGGVELACREAQRLFERHKVQRYFLHLYPQTCSHTLNHLLARAGVARYHRGWVQFVRGDEPIAERTSPLEVRRARASDAPAVAEILCQGFDVDSLATPLWTSVIGRQGWHVFVATAGELVIAAGAVFIEGEHAYLAFSATRPGWRCRGAQGALMHARIQHALESGCRSIVTETGEAVAGEENHSYRNMLRYGFTAVALRHNYGPAHQTW